MRGIIIPSALIALVSCAHRAPVAEHDRQAVTSPPVTLPLIQRDGEAWVPSKNATYSSFMPKADLLVREHSRRAMFALTVLDREPNPLLLATEFQQLFERRGAAVRGIKHTSVTDERGRTVALFAFAGKVPPGPGGEPFVFAGVCAVVVLHSHPKHPVLLVGSWPTAASKEMALRFTAAVLGLHMDRRE